MLMLIKAKQERNKQSLGRTQMPSKHLQVDQSMFFVCRGDFIYADKCIHTELMKGLVDGEINGDILSKVDTFLLDQTIAFCGGPGERSALLGGAARLRSGWTTGKAPADTVWRHRSCICLLGPYSFGTKDLREEKRRE